MIRPKIDPDEARLFLEEIDNNKFYLAISKNWHVDEERYIKAQNVVLLFCWAKTKMGNIDNAYDTQTWMISILFDII